MTRDNPGILAHRPTGMAATDAPAITLHNNDPVAVVMVGLPATGKTFTARNLSRYLRWLGVPTRTFSVARYRKEHIGEGLRADFFDPANIGALNERTKIADMALDELIRWIKDERGKVGILDASNTTSARRMIIRERLEEKCNIECIFLECQYTQIQVAQHVNELQMTCPEYKGLSPADAIADFTRRIELYRPHYTSVESDSGDHSYIQVIDGGAKIVVNRVHGYLSSRMIYYLMTLRNRTRSIWLFPIDEQAPSPKSQASCCQAATARLDDIALLIPTDCGPISVWTNTTDIILDQDDGQAHTPKARAKIIQKPRLRGLEEGIVDLDGQMERRQSNPYYHRFPQGESYHDLTLRLEPIIMELERAAEDVLIAADISVVRCIYGYFVEIRKMVLFSLKN